MTHHDCWALPLGYVMDFYSIALNNVFLKIAEHAKSLPPLASAFAI